MQVRPKGLENALNPVTLLLGRRPRDASSTSRTTRPTRPRRSSSPRCVAGRFDRPGDADWYHLHGQGGRAGRDRPLLRAARPAGRPARARHRRQGAGARDRRRPRHPLELARHVQPRPAGHVQRPRPTAGIGSSCRTPTATAARASSTPSASASPPPTSSRSPSTRRRPTRAARSSARGDRPSSSSVVNRRDGFNGAVTVEAEGLPAGRVVPARPRQPPGASSLPSSSRPPPTRPSGRAPCGSRPGRRSTAGGSSARSGSSQKALGDRQHQHLAVTPRDRPGRAVDRPVRPEGLDRPADGRRRARRSRRRSRSIATGPTSRGRSRSTGSTCPPASTSPRPRSPRGRPRSRVTCDRRRERPPRHVHAGLPGRRPGPLQPRPERHSPGRTSGSPTRPRRW